MNWQSIASTVGNVAGALAPLLAGPVGLAVSIGSQIAGVLGVEDTPEAVERALTQSPDARLTLQKWAIQEREQIRQAHIELQQLALETHKAELADTQQARASHKDHWMPSVLSVALFVLFSALSGALFLLAIPEGNRDLIVYLAGQVSGFFATSVVYWLGSSRGSKEKDKFNPNKSPHYGPLK
ncbi:hypothetical protein [Shewanella surugensis]|uniref:Holin of 3TMs, for gene-transfer release n=1 Tax=Shewanella surugensis TaxID=212020 RepID=A0ABT0L749_9GAMM|nr:hypothetical protein [Shewanella surugensis]MCL1123526.1 hypothetical protein [Shewanella surugensis]